MSGQPPSLDLMDAVVAAFAERVAQRVCELLRESQPKPPTQDTRYLTERAVAQRIGISMKTLQCWRSYGRGPQYRKAGRRVLYEIAKLQQWIAGCDRDGSDAQASAHALTGHSARRAAREVHRDA